MCVQNKKENILAMQVKNNPVSEDQNGQYGCEQLSSSIWSNSLLVNQKLSS
jgi:hypothetical protein